MSCASWAFTVRTAPALTANITRFSQFLTLVGLTALIVGGSHEQSGNLYRKIKTYSKHDKFQWGTERDCNDERAAICNARLAEIMAELRACAPDMDSTARGMLQAWTVAGEAIRLWNLVGAAVAGGRADTALATSLERWFESYKRLWRATCRESELSRIADMVGWYVDRLRG